MFDYTHWNRFEEGGGGEYKKIDRDTKQDREKNRNTLKDISKDRRRKTEIKTEGHH